MREGRYGTSVKHLLSRVFHGAALGALCCAGLVGGGCAPDPQAPVDVMALVLTAQGVYQPRQVQLRTVEDVVKLEGAVGRIRSGANVRVDFSDRLLATPNLDTEDLRRIFVKNEGSSPSVSYVSYNGALWPNDFDGWNLVTTYYNFEQAFLYFQALGIPAEELTGSLIYYAPNFVFAPDNPLEDNAFFYSPIQAFAILPFRRYQRVPLSMNQGVIAHEYAHQVFNRRVYRGLPVPVPFTLWGSSVGVGATPQLNLLRSLDEGLADYHAFGATCRSEFGCDTRFISSSVDEEQTDQRDIAKQNCLTAGLRNALNTSSVEAFTSLGTEYRVGTVIATAFYQAAAGDPRNHPVLQTSVLNAYSALEQQITNNLAAPETFTLPMVGDLLVANVTYPGLRRNLCNELADHLQIPLSSLPSCPTSASAGNTCPKLGP